MTWSLTPARRRGVEMLDDPGTPAGVRQAAMADIALSNALFGGTRSAVIALRRVVSTLPRSAVLVDVGTGTGDIAAAMVREARRTGVSVTAVGLDVSESPLRDARDRLAGMAVADAMRLPMRDASADVVLCSQLLHHFEEPDALRVIAELDRISRGYVIISDLRRSWIAAAGWLLASLALRFHPITRHDGVASVLRGFTREELAALITRATGARPRARRGLFWRLSVTWAPTRSAALLEPPL